MPKLSPHSGPNMKDLFWLLLFFLYLKGSERDYQLWVNSGKEAAPYPLIGECLSKSKIAPMFPLALWSWAHVPIPSVYYELDNGIFSLRPLMIIVGKHIFLLAFLLYKQILPSPSLGVSSPWESSVHWNWSWFVYQSLELPVVSPTPALMTRLPPYTEYWVGYSGTLSLIPEHGTSAMTQNSLSITKKVTLTHFNS